MKCVGCLKRLPVWRGIGSIVLLSVAVSGRCICEAGELTVDGSLVVKTNLVVNGQVVLENVVIKTLQPQGDLSMGSYTNRSAK